MPGGRPGQVVQWLWVVHARAVLPAPCMAILKITFMPASFRTSGVAAEECCFKSRDASLMSKRSVAMCGGGRNRVCGRVTPISWGVVGFCDGLWEMRHNFVPAEAVPGFFPGPDLGRSRLCSVGSSAGTCGQPLPDGMQDCSI